MQVRSGARNTAIDARQRVLDRFSDAKANMIHSDFGVSLRKVVNAADDPSEAETTKFWHIMAVFADNMYNAIRLHDEGVLDDEAFDYIAGAFVRTCATPGGNSWFDGGAIMPQGREGETLAVVGGTGDFINVRGEGVQMFTGMGFDFTIEFDLTAGSGRP